jgi:HAD superfamily hydrolase (TIGR01509 family)
MLPFRTPACRSRAGYYRHIGPEPVTGGGDNVFQAVLFDMDGLLLDSERVLMRAWTVAAADEGLAIPPEIYAGVIGRASQESHRLFVEMFGGVERYERLRVQVNAAIGRERDQAVFPLKDGVRELLSALRARGVPLAVASSSRAEEIRHRLQAVGVLTHFDAVAGGNEVEQGKPDPAVYQLAARRLGIDPTACLAFEDSENGARAALAAGAALVVVPDLRRPAEEVIARSLHVFDTLHDALAYVPHWFPRAN